MLFGFFSYHCSLEYPTINHKNNFQYLIPLDYWQSLNFLRIFLLGIMNCLQYYFHLLVLRQINLWVFMSLWQRYLRFQNFPQFIQEFLMYFFTLACCLSCSFRCHFWNNLINLLLFHLLPFLFYFPFHFYHNL